MTTSLVHDLSSRLDPSVLARDVPLKRTGTVDVGFLYSSLFELVKLTRVAGHGGGHPFPS